jgi:hypothetical protein
VDGALLRKGVKIVHDEASDAEGVLNPVIEHEEKEK